MTHYISQLQSKHIKVWLLKSWIVVLQSFVSKLKTRLKRIQEFVVMDILQLVTPQLVQCLIKLEELALLINLQLITKENVWTPVQITFNGFV